MKKNTVAAVFACLILVNIVLASSNYTTIGFLLNMTGTLIAGNNYAGIVNNISVNNTSVVLAPVHKGTVYADDRSIYASSDSERYLLIISVVQQNELDAYERFSSAVGYYGSYDGMEEWQGRARNYVRVDYAEHGIDIASRIRWGSGFHRILIKNNGSAVEPKIIMEVLE